MYDLRNKSKETDLLVVSIIAILFELVSIRWIGSNIKLIAYFSNLVLVSCFLGLGWGFLLGQSSIKLKNLFPLFILIFIIVILTLKQFNLISVDPSEHLYIFQYEYIPVAKKISFFYVTIATFIINTITFIPLGQIIGNLFISFDKPLVAYCINITGNIIAVLLFIALSFLWTGPVVWFFILFLLFMWFLRDRKAHLFYGLIIFTICLLFLSRSKQKGEVVEYWSPYYRVSLTPIILESNKEKIGYKLNVDGERHQDSLDFLNPSLMDSWYRWWPELYKMPYRFGKPKKLLILGAGSGNDVYFALKNNVEEIHAVEIDPAIIKIGKIFHPQKPYAHQGHLVVINDDARSFLTNTDEKYDLIIFSTLDSHKLASYIAVGLRLDNFLYTIECFELIKKHLKENGILVLQNGGPPWMIARIYNGLREVFGKIPDVYQLKIAPYQILNYVVSLGDRLPNPDSPQDLIRYDNFDQFAFTYKSLNDDWPFLYLEDRKIPKSYLQVILFIIIFSGVGISTTFHFKKSIRGIPLAYNLHFLVMGIAFLLLETASISRAAILFGCTWLTTSVIIVCILIYILIANVLVIKKKINSLRFLYFLLFLSLIFCYFIPIQKILGYPLMLRLSIGAFLLSLPVLFSAMIFAITFKAQRYTEIILGINLLGAVIGGLSEYINLIIGMKNLYLITLCLYMISFLVLSMSRKLETVTATS